MPFLSGCFLRRRIKQIRIAESMRVLKRLPVKSILEHLYPMKGTLRTVKIANPDKHGEEHLIGGKAEPILAFDKPRLPPELGPLIVLSYLEMSSGNDEDD